MIKVASFFSGIGGIDLGLERAGMKVIFQCEINTFGQQILKKHWPEIQLEGDINDVKAKDIPAADLWCGGFPCQDLSLANQGKRHGLEGARSGLFYMFAELIRAQEKKPRWIFMENRYRDLSDCVYRCSGAPDGEHLRSRRQRRGRQDGPS